MGEEGRNEWESGVWGKERHPESFFLKRTSICSSGSVFTQALGRINAHTYKYECQTPCRVDVL